MVFKRLLFTEPETFRYSLRWETNFNAGIKDKISKAYRGIGIIKKLQGNLPRNALLTIFKSFVDYGDIVCDRPTNDFFVKNWKASSTMLHSL